MRIFSAKGALAALALLAGVTSLANAQQPSSAQANAIRQNCRSDYESYCSSVPPGGQASLNCLAQNQSKLSPACGQAVAAATGGGATAAAPAAPVAQPASVPPHGPLSPPPQMSPREEMFLMREACGRDYRRVCTGVPVGGGNALRCLANHSQSLSPGCEQALMMMHARR